MQQKIDLVHQQHTTVPPHVQHAFDFIGRVSQIVVRPTRRGRNVVQFGRQRQIGRAMFTESATAGATAAIRQIRQCKRHSPIRLVAKRHGRCSVIELRVVFVVLMLALRKHILWFNSFNRQMRIVERGQRQRRSVAVTHGTQRCFGGTQIMAWKMHQFKGDGAIDEFGHSWVKRTGGGPMSKD